VSELVVDGQLAFRIGREGDDLVAEWIDLCEIRSDRSAERTSFVAREGAEPRLIAKVRAGVGAALLRHLRGETSLHASAVAKDGRALAFLGRSGAGKSTLAAWLCLARGFALVADDIVQVDVDSRRVLAVPTEKEHWLEVASHRALGLPSSAESGGGKSAVPAGRIADGPTPLVALFSLALDPTAPAAPTVARMRGHRAIEVLVPCLVRFVIDEPRAQIAELERIAELLELVPLYEIRVRRDYGALPAIADALESLP
jgi:hypothetical protein